MEKWEQLAQHYLEFLPCGGVYLAHFVEDDEVVCPQPSRWDVGRIRVPDDSEGRVYGLHGQIRRAGQPHSVHGDKFTRAFPGTNIEPQLPQSLYWHPKTDSCCLETHMSVYPVAE